MERSRVRLGLKLDMISHDIQNKDRIESKWNLPSSEIDN